MLSRFNESRRWSDDLKLGALTAFSAGMTNVASVVLFFAFTSNITGHYAVLAEELAKGNWYQLAVVFLWISLFLGGGFISNQCIINSGRHGRQLGHAAPLLLEAACLIGVGFYGLLAYRETLLETELLVAALVFAMGLQNGLTASISNLSVKTTHLTGLTTDLAIHLSMMTKRRWREKPEVRRKAVLLGSIALAYITGGFVAGSITHAYQFKVFFAIAVILLITLLYDHARMVSREAAPHADRAQLPAAGHSVPALTMAMSDHEPILDSSMKHQRGREALLNAG